jgi:chemotaxis protein CheD
MLTERLAMKYNISERSDMIKTIGVGDFAVVNDGGGIIKTYALGSCVAVMAWDWKRKIAGMVHIAHPRSTINEEKARDLPGYFADTGVRILLKQMELFGAERGKMWVKMAGGAAVMEQIQQFDIGKENVLAVRKILWESRMGILKSDVGGGRHRTVWIEAGTGKVHIRHNDEEWTL